MALDTASWSFETGSFTGGLMPKMTRGRYYSSVMPIAGIIYVIVLFATGFNATAVVIGALVSP